VLGVDILDINKQFLDESTRQLCNEKCRHKFTFAKIDGKVGLSFKNEFDLAISWSAAEHIENFQNITDQIYRSLKNHGLFFLQTYPLWKSAWGHHLFEWLPPYYHLNHSFKEIFEHLEKMKEVPIATELKNGELTRELKEILLDRNMSQAEWLLLCKETLLSCNQITVQEILRMIEKSGFVISKVKLITSTSHLPNFATDILDSLVDGIILLAYKP